MSAWLPSTILTWSTHCLLQHAEPCRSTKGTILKLPLPSGELINLKHSPYYLVMLFNLSPIQTTVLVSWVLFCSKYHFLGNSLFCGFLYRFAGSFVLAKYWIILFGRFSVNYIWKTFYLQKLSIVLFYVLCWVFVCSKYNKLTLRL